VAYVGWTYAACFVCSHISPICMSYHLFPPLACSGPLRPHQASLWVGSCLSENYFWERRVLGPAYDSIGTANYEAGTYCNLKQVLRDSNTPLSPLMAREPKGTS
jgi:hypothetical protein